MIYIEVAVSNLMLEDSVIGKLLNRLLSMDTKEIYGTLENNSLGISDTKELFTLEEAMAAMFAGNAVLFVDGYDRAIKIGSKGYPGSGVQKTDSEKGLRGSKEAFSESVKMNTALIRKRIRNAKMKAEGRFPVYQTTERPDRAAQAILEGRVVLLTDNSPEALIFPATLNSLFQTADDYYRNERIVTFLRLIRYVAAFLALALPGLYVAAATFHPQLLPGNLIRSMAEARSGVPFPTAAEVLLMELSFELLREAGLRMPGPAGNTIGIVGGLIVGQAAVSANLVSPITVTVAALTALGSFSIPNEELSEVFRLWKYGILLLGSCFGILGVMLGCFLLLMLMAEQESYGIPWLYPYVGGNLNERADEKDSMFLAAARKRKRRPIFAKWGNRIRFRRKS